ncbi:MAG: hypothetical protein AAGJ93_14685, partial [Bacteroidota bacterium]
MKFIRFSLFFGLLITLFSPTFAANIEVVGIQCICENGGLGGIKIGITDAAPGYTLSWTGPVGYTSTEQSISDLIIPGEYILTYTNAAGCGFMQEPITVGLCEAPQRIDMEAVPICEEEGTGAVVCNPVGRPIEDFAFSWSTGATGQHLENVQAGVYSVTITYDGTCEIVETAEVVDGYDADFSISLQNEIDCICSNEPTTAFTLGSDGVNSPFTFNWEGPLGFQSIEQNPLISNQGVYAVTVVDVNGCEFMAETEVLSCSSGLSLELLGSLASSCPNGEMAEIEVEILGDSYPYTLEWENNGESFASSDLGEDYSTVLSGFLPGTYEFKVTDKYGCQYTTTIDINASPALVLSNEMEIINCNGMGQGSINPEITSGLGPFEYLWNTGETSASINGLSEGSYQLTITDRFDCEFSFDFNLVDGHIPLLNNSVTHAVCDELGSISLSIAPPDDYGITWSNGIVDETELTNLSSGLYGVTVTDPTGCTEENIFIVFQQDAQSGYWDEVEIQNIVPASTEGVCDGSVSLSLGENGPYTIVVENNDEENFNTYTNIEGTLWIENLCPDTRNYNIFITDSNGCQWEESVNVPLCSFGIHLIEAQNPTTSESTDGSITIAIEESVMPANIQWSNGNTGTSISNLTSGTYTVTVTNEDGCINTRSYELEPCFRYS